MGRRRREKQRGAEAAESYTLPPSPSHSFSSSSSSSDFEFSISISPRKSSTLLCPADELFYKGQLLPLHLSPRISMVRTLLLSSPVPPRDSTASTASSSSSAFTNDCDSSRPSSATDDDTHPFINNNYKKPTTTSAAAAAAVATINNNNNRYFSRFSRFSSVFRKPRVDQPESLSASVSEPSISVKRSMGTTAKEVIRKCLKKVKKPLCEKFSHKQREHKTAPSLFCTKTERSTAETEVSDVPSSLTKKKEEITEEISAVVTSSSCSSHSFSGNLRYPRRRSTYVSSCPSSMRSSPTHSGVLSGGGRVAGGGCYADASTMEELQSAIQGAIAHCKNSLVQDKTVVQFGSGGSGGSGSD